jgi:hypothetical protein
MNRSGQELLAALMTRVDELGRVCARLGQENAELRAEVSRLSAGPVRAVQVPGAPAMAESRSAAPASAAVPAVPDTGDGAGPRKISRRKVGKALGAVAASAVGAAALVEMTQPAAAATGSSVTAGNVTTGEGRTSVLYDGAANFLGVVLLGNDSTYDGGNGNFPAGIGGWAGAGSTAGKGGVKNGVYGYTDNGGGNGVVGYNSGFVAGSGAGVLGLAFTASNIAVQGKNTAGTAVSGSSDSTASSATAIIGTLTSTSPGGFSAAVRGVNNGTGGLGIGVWGSQAGSGWGVYGTSNSGVGVEGSGGTGTGVAGSGATGVSASGSTVGVVASGPTAVTATGGTTGVTASGTTAVKATGSGATGVAVVAASASSTTAIKATNTGTGAALNANNTGPGACVQATSTNGRGGSFAGKAAQIQLVAGTGATHPTSGKTGDLYVDNTARLWFCKVGGTTATWVKIV